MSVVEAVSRDLEAIRGRDEALAESGLAASALALAWSIDDPDTSATARSMCARELRDTLDRLRALAPPAQKADGLDELRGKRAKRQEIGARKRGVAG